MKKKERASLAKLPWINRDMKPISVRTPGLLRLPAPDTVVISLNQLNLNKSPLDVNLETHAAERKTQTNL